MMTNSSLHPIFTSLHPFVTACSASCTRLLRKLRSIKAALQSEFRYKTSESNHMVQLALNEAEALAYETGFPALIFPTLAREKLEAVAAWDGQQRSVRRVSSERIFFPRPVGLLRGRGRTPSLFSQ